MPKIVLPTAKTLFCAHNGVCVSLNMRNENVQYHTTDIYFRSFFVQTDLGITKVAEEIKRFATTYEA